MSKVDTVSGYWVWRKWWHRIIRRKTVVFEINGGSYSYDGKKWGFESPIYPVPSDQKVVVSLSQNQPPRDTE